GARGARARRAPAPAQARPAARSGRARAPPGVLDVGVRGRRVGGRGRDRPAARAGADPRRQAGHPARRPRGAPRDRPGSVAPHPPRRADPPPGLRLGNPVTRRLVENPFYVLGLRPGASRAEIEDQAQKLLGMLALGLHGAFEYATPLGMAERTPDAV